MHLLSWRATLSWMDVNLLITIDVSHHGLAFSNSVLSWVLLWAIPGVCYALTPTSSPCTSLSMLFIHSTSLFCSFCFHILLQKVLLPLHPVIGLSSCIRHLLIDRIFYRFFFKECLASFFFFCIGWLCLWTFYVSLLSTIYFNLSLQFALSG